MTKLNIPRSKLATLCLSVALLYLVWSYKGCHYVAELSRQNGVSLSLCSTDPVRKQQAAVVISMDDPGKTDRIDYGNMEIGKTDANKVEVNNRLQDKDTKRGDQKLKDTLSKPRGESEFEKAIRKYADEGGTVVLSLMDSGTEDMAINLYLTSYKTFNINNYLFITTDNNSCQSLAMQIPDVHCFQYANDKDGRVASSFGTKAFVRKTHYKTQAVLEAVQLGFHVLLVDIDIVLFQNPFPYLDQCPQCDLQVQWDHNMVCSGFFHVRATEWGCRFMENVWAITVSKKMASNDQKYFSSVFNNLKGHKEFIHKVLPEDQFSNGNEYFSQRHIMFATDAEYPPKVYLVHDNWIISQAAKMYRFKENLMWMYDKNGYYSNRDAKYIEYGMDTAPGSSIDIELNALKTALVIGHVLNRIVILPSFTCINCDTKQFGACLVKSGRCSFQTHFKVEEFDRHLQNMYREHVFLMHPLVPDTVKSSKSKPLHINVGNIQSDQKVKGNKNVTVLDLRRTIITEQDLLKVFSKYSNISVLVFEHLHGVLSTFSKSDQAFVKFNPKLNSAFKNSTYVQR